jgi:ribonuclease HI
MVDTRTHKEVVAGYKAAFAERWPPLPRERMCEGKKPKKTSLPIFTIYTDGSVQPENPGAAGYTAIILPKNSEPREVTGSFEFSTNNRMEVFAAVAGLEALMEPSQVTLISDSKYLVNTMNKGWSQGANHDLWKRLRIQIEKHKVVFEWCKGHAGNTYNELADKLAYSAALTQNNSQIDKGYVVNGR